jgi:ribosomal protein S18 acetylase RimI-like enzyme
LKKEGNYIKVVNATIDDIREWLNLASEVEYLFGPMVDVPNFVQALKNNINRNTAFCIRENDGTSGSQLLGGLLWSPSSTIYKINWLSVSTQARQMGVATELIKHALMVVKAPAEVLVTTFGEDITDGKPARMLYQKFGFIPLDEKISNGPEGGSRQKFKLKVHS